MGISLCLFGDLAVSFGYVENYTDYNSSMCAIRKLRRTELRRIVSGDRQGE